MRLKRLDLKAFGPFTDRTLDFGSTDPDLHIIFGPNEAGKSSALRALRALLYGFQQQTPDNFIHSYDQLLVGGCLLNSAGKEITFFRRKKRVGDIIDEAGNPLDVGVLTPFLHGIEQQIFESLYGLDHEALVQGGEDILAQKGEVGQALFAAGAGISSLREVIDQLEKEAADLFKVAGQLPEINKAIKRYKELQKEAREASLSVKDWKIHRKSLANGEAERGSLEKERTRKNQELHRLRRLYQAIPELASLKMRNEQLLALGETVLLPPGFETRFQRVSQEVREAGLQLQRDSLRLKKLDEKYQAISVNKDLLAQIGRVNDFHQRLGEYLKGQKDRPERNGMRISLRKDAAQLLQQVRPDLKLEEVETLRPVLVKKRTVQTLSSRYEMINQKLSLAQKQCETAELERMEAEQGLARLEQTKESPTLSQAVKLAQKAGDIDTQIDKNSRDLQQSKKDSLTDLNRIGLWSGSLTALIELSLPLSQTVQQFEKSFGMITDEKREVKVDRRKIEKALRTTRTEMKNIEYTTAVPCEKELETTRSRRDKGWQLLRRQWLDHEDVSRESLLYTTDQSLPDAYEGLVGQADLIADRLRREADRVASAASLRGQTDLLEDSLAENDKDLTTLELQEQSLTSQWQNVWRSAQIDPLSPKEMGGWLAEIDKLRFKVADIFKKEEELDQVLEQRRNHVQAITRELHFIGEKCEPEREKLAFILNLAETVLEKISSQKSDLARFIEKKEKAAKALQQTMEDLKSSRAAKVDWGEQWQKALFGLAAHCETTTLEALELIDILQSCFDKLKEAEDLQKRIDGIDRDVAELDQEVKSVVEAVSPDLMVFPLDQKIMQLRVKVDQAQKDTTLHDKLSDELDSLKGEVFATQKTMQAATGQMTELLATAKCDKPEEAGVVIDKFYEYKALVEKITETKTALAKIGAGVPSADLALQAAEVNVDELPGLIETLTDDIEQRINPEINRVSQVIGEENTKLATMDGGAKAADLATDKEQELARIRRLADKYVLVKLASRVLQQEIERYREEHQDPVMKIGSRYFNDLTKGSFAALRSDVDDKGEPVLVGVRPDKMRLTVGKMSSGTRDQLYLALRLATLEWRLETSEPMPFIVDDILINFDDDRSRATLGVLAEISKKNQVILFTHHQQIVDEAKSLTVNGTIQIHDIREIH